MCYGPEPVMCYVKQLIMSAHCLSPSLEKAKMVILQKKC